MALSAATNASVMNAHPTGTQLALEYHRIA